MKRVDRIGDITIGLVFGFIFGILLMLVLLGCVPGCSAAACPPARPHAGIDDCAGLNPSTVADVGSASMVGGCEETSWERTTVPQDRKCRQPGQPPISLDENRTGRAADRTGESSVQSESQEDRFDSAQARLARLFDAIRQVESGGNENPPDGDGGKAIGEYQIWNAFWQDSGVPGDYQQCRNRAYAERVILRYWRRHCLEALDADDWRVLAMVHHYGPSGVRCADRHGYWNKIQAARNLLDTRSSAR